MHDEYTLRISREKATRRRDLIERIVIARVAHRGIMKTLPGDAAFKRAAELADKIIEVAP